MKTLSIWSITGCILACSATWGLAHEWNTVSGHSLEAEFVRKVGTQVYLRAKDGSIKSAVFRPEVHLGSHFSYELGFQ